MTRNNIISLKGLCKELDFTLKQLYDSVMQRKNRDGLPKILWVTPDCPGYKSEEYRLILTEWSGEWKGLFTIQAKLDGKTSWQIYNQRFDSSTKLADVLSLMGGFKDKNHFLTVMSAENLA